MVIMMENESQSELLGNADAPDTNALAQEYGLATQSYAVGHPSLPNYLELLSGSDFGVTSDDAPSSVNIPAGDQTLVNQLEAAGISWRAYLEDMPTAGYTGGDAGGVDPYGGDYYVQHHDPFVYFPAVTSLADFTSNVVPLSTNVTSDLDSENAPSFVWVTPNAVDDMHDGPSNADGDVDPSAGDAWLGNFVSQVESTGWYAQGGNIIIEWDEGMDSDTSGTGDSGADSGGGHIVTIDVSAALKAAPAHDASPVNTAGILHSIEDAYGLPYLGDAADAANGNIDTLLSPSPPPTTTTAPTTAPTTTPTTTAPTTTPATTPTTAPTTTPTTVVTTTPPTTPTSDPSGSTTAVTTSTTTAGPAPAATTATTAAPPTTPTTAPPIDPLAAATTATSSTTTTGLPTTAGADPRSGGGSQGSIDPSVVSAPSSSLAFTGSGPGVTTLSIVGGGLVLLGIVLFTLTGVARQPVRQLALLRSWERPHGGDGGSPGAGGSRRSDLWLVPPSA
jgi:acid phosphatase